MNVNKRFIYAFGGAEDAGNHLEERFARFDTLKYQGWKCIFLTNPSEFTGRGYGVIALQEEVSSNDKLSFLVFGGYNDDEDMDRSCVF